jgi:hypothetical protein
LATWRGEKEREGGRERERERERREVSELEENFCLPACSANHVGRAGILLDSKGK